MGSISGPNHRSTTVHHSTGDAAVDETEDVPEAAPAQVEPNPDQVVPMPLPMQQVNQGGSTARPGDGDQPLRADAVSGSSARVDSAACQAMMMDVAASYDQMGQQMQMQFARLMAESRGRKEEIEQTIKQ